MNPEIEARLRAMQIETPSWGYGAAGTRFGAFPSPGLPRDVQHPHILDAVTADRACCRGQ